MDDAQQISVDKRKHELLVQLWKKLERDLYDADVDDIASLLGTDICDVLEGLEEWTKDVYVRARLTDGTSHWMTVRAESLEEGIKFAEALDYIDAVLEASFVPGGVVT